jgi:hypothetical protein
MGQIRVADMRMENSATSITRITTSHPPPYYEPESPKLKNGNSESRRNERQHRRKSHTESAAVFHDTISCSKCSAPKNRLYKQAERLLWKLIDFLDRHKLLPSVTPEEMLRREKRRSGKITTCQPPESARAACPNTSSTAQEAYSNENFIPPFDKDQSPIPGETILDRAFRLQYISGPLQQGSEGQKLMSWGWPMKAGHLQDRRMAEAWRRYSRGLLGSS